MFNASFPRDIGSMQPMFITFFFHVFIFFFISPLCNPSFAADIPGIKNWYGSIFWKHASINIHTKKNDRDKRNSHPQTQIPSIGRDRIESPTISFHEDEKSPPPEQLMLLSYFHLQFKTKHLNWLITLMKIVIICMYARQNKIKTRFIFITEQCLIMNWLTHMAYSTFSQHFLKTIVSNKQSFVCYQLSIRV